MTTSWRTAMAKSLYGPDGFFTTGAGPSAHFRTSVHATPLFTTALLNLLNQVDKALNHPANLDVVDIGAGRGELLTALQTALTPPRVDHGVVVRDSAGVPGLLSTTSPGSTGDLGERVRFVGVEVAARPDGLHPGIGWTTEVPAGICGLLIATEWLDNVPVDVVEVDEAGVGRLVCVDADGNERLGAVIDAADLFWTARWWPLGGPGTRVEIGWTRDLAWADAVAHVERGCALAVDYGHVRGGRPVFGSLTGYRDGRQVPPVPDGRSDVTAHVAMDAVAGAVGSAYTLRSQRDALRALGVDGARPPLTLASSDPGAYVRALSSAGAAAELTDPAGLGGHWWLLHSIGDEARGIMPQ